MCSIIEHMKDNQDYFEILRKIYNKPDSSQREIAVNLGFSLGKLNYCLKALQQKGLVKIENFNKKQDKVKYIQYILTPKGIVEKTNITIRFMKQKMSEYDELKLELLSIKAKSKKWKKI